MSETLAIYGAGLMGREIAAQLARAGTPARCFLDRRAAELGAVDGLPVIAPEAAAAWAGDATVIIGLHSPAHPVAAVGQSLRAAGWARVSTLWQWCHDRNWTPERGFWLGAAGDAQVAPPGLAEVRALFADATSRDIFDQQCRLRFLGDYDGLVAPDLLNQYAPSDLPPPVEPLAFVDCGAFDGDTLRALARRHQFSDVIAIEPDAGNLGPLEGTLRALGVGSVVHAGVGAQPGELRFAAGQGAASHVATHGNIIIPVTTIDHLCAQRPVNFIKMDIEGAEHDALDGALRTIVRDRPRLAISAYHRPDDLWTLPRKLAALCPGYAFYLRSHGYNGFDTVLYGIPPDSTSSH